MPACHRPLRLPGGDFTALPTAAGRDDNDDRATHAELRYSSDPARPFNFLMGAAYLYDARDNQKSTFVGPGTLDSYVAAPVYSSRMIAIGRERAAAHLDSRSIPRSSYLEVSVFQPTPSAPHHVHRVDMPDRDIQFVHARYPLGHSQPMNSC